MRNHRRITFSADVCEKDRAKLFSGHAFEQLASLIVRQMPFATENALLEHPRTARIQE